MTTKKALNYTLFVIDYDILEHKIIGTHIHNKNLVKSQHREDELLERGDGLSVRDRTGVPGADLLGVVAHYLHLYYLDVQSADVD